MGLGGRGEDSVQRHGLDQVEDLLDLRLRVHHQYLAAARRQCLARLEDRTDAGAADVVQGAELQHQDVSLWRRLQQRGQALIQLRVALRVQAPGQEHVLRSEEHTSELQSLMRISYVVICLIKQNHTTAY